MPPRILDLLLRGKTKWVRGKEINVAAPPMK